MTLYHETMQLKDGHRVGLTLNLNPRKEALVFLHGFSVNRRLYDPMLKLLDPEFEITAIDLAGHGDTDSLPLGHSFDDVVDLTVRSLVKAGVEQATFVGHSFGGRVAAEIAAQTDLVDKLILMGAAVGQPFDDYENQSPLVKMIGIPMRAAAAVVDTWCESPWNIGFGADILGAIWSSWPGFLRVGWAATFGVDTIVALDAILYNQIPTTIIHGERDLIVPLACAKSAADVAGARLEVIPDAYHSWMIEDPGLGAQMIKWVLE